MNIDAYIARARNRLAYRQSVLDAELRAEPDSDYRPEFERRVKVEEDLLRALQTATVATLPCIMSEYRRQAVHHMREDTGELARYRERERRANLFRQIYWLDKECESLPTKSAQFASNVRKMEALRRKLGR